MADSSMPSLASLQELVQRQLNLQNQTDDRKLTASIQQIKASLTKTKSKRTTKILPRKHEQRCSPELAPIESLSPIYVQVKGISRKESLPNAQSRHSDGDDDGDGDEINDDISDISSAGISIGSETMQNCNDFFP
jgi:hypothetical protein